MGRKGANIILQDSEIFIIFVTRYFDNLLNGFGYSRKILNQGTCEVVSYTKMEIGQVIKFIYDFRRSDKPYFQVYFEIERKGTIGNKHKLVEVTNFIKQSKEPQTIQETLAKIKEIVIRFLMPVILGDKWFDEISSDHKDMKI